MISNIHNTKGYRNAMQSQQQMLYKLWKHKSNT